MTLALTSLAVISLIAHSPVGVRVINYVFDFEKGREIVKCLCSTVP